MEATEEQVVPKRGKRILKPRTHSTKEMYRYYKIRYPKSRIPYWMFKEVIAHYNKKASDAIIFGGVLNLGARLGDVIIKKIRRNYTKPVVNWGESKIAKKKLIEQGITPKDETHPDGEEWMVFYTDSWYLRWAWSKKRVCKVRNQTVYKFLPTSNKSKKAGDNSLNKLGNKGKLALANRMNPNLHVIYENVNRFD